MKPFKNIIFIFLTVLMFSLLSCKDDDGYAKEGVIAISVSIDEAAQTTVQIPVRGGKAPYTILNEDKLAVRVPKASVTLSGNTMTIKGNSDGKGSGIVFVKSSDNVLCRFDITITE